MKELEAVREAAAPLGDSISISDELAIAVLDPTAVRERIAALVENAVFAENPVGGSARWLVRSIAADLGAYPASIHDLYLARGAGKSRNDYTVPAMNLRALPFHAARAAFRAAAALDAKAVIFEIARSEMGYTDQRPAEYAACVLGAAVAEGYQGPVFIQGDHFQVNAKRYRSEPGEEVQAIHSLIQESIIAGFFNIDIDTSTLVDLEKPTIDAQQELNYRLAASFAAVIRQLQPAGIDISIGGEIGEVGGQNSTEEELTTYMEGFNRSLFELLPDAAGLSKISIQTGTSHGGVVLPDGSIASVKVDFETLRQLSDVARRRFGMAGAVQHGASTLPLDAFVRFHEAGACEVHLATNFQNILYELMPDDLREEIYTYLGEAHTAERKAGQTDEQFHYNARKRALGPFKALIWDMEPEYLSRVQEAWQAQFALLFERLNIRNSAAEVEQWTSKQVVIPPLQDFFAEALIDEDVSDLAD